MRRFIGVVMVLALLAASVMPAAAQTKPTLDKIGETGTLTIGTRTGSPPFAYVNARNEWVGFSVDLVEELIKPALEKKLGKPIKVEKKESTPPTRIPLLSSGAVDLIAGTMTDTRTRRDSVDFSITFFVTGAQFLVKKGSPIKGIKNIDAIAKVPGVGVLWVAASSDLAAAYRLPGNAPELEAARQTMLKACIANKVVCGINPTNAADAAKRVKEGWRYIEVGRIGGVAAGPAAMIDAVKKAQ